MTKWAFVENGEVKEVVGELPNNWKNVSGLNLSSDNPEFLKNLGWFPVVESTQEYDENLYYITNINYVFSEESVIEEVTIEEKIEQDNEDSQNFESFMYYLRQERDLRLKESDWSQLQDVQNSLSEEEKMQWVLYRQKLRDLPYKYSNGNTTSTDLIIWPSL